MPLFDKNFSNVITGHVAWYGIMNQFMSELFLHAHKPMSYILWQIGEEEHRYCFSYVVEIFIIHHTFFFFDPTTLLWRYRSQEVLYEYESFHQILQCIMKRHGQDHWRPIIHPSENPLYLWNDK